MTAASLAAALVERGLEPAERRAKQSLFDLVLRACADSAKTPAPRHVFWVPGRLEVFGKHTDYAGGRTMVSAVPRGMVVAGSPRPDGTIHIRDASRSESVTLACAPDAQEGIRAGFSGWRHYAEVVARRLGRNFPDADIGADLVIGSDLPRASGMSSSSALVVGLAAALVRIGGLETRPEWRANISSTLEAAGYYACIENGRTFGTLEGDAGVGTHGGSEDHAAILTGVPRTLSVFGFMPMRHLADVDVPPAWRFVLSPCGVRSAKTGAALLPYNRLSRGAQVLLDLWNTAEAPAASLGAALRCMPVAGSPAPGANLDALGRLRELVRRSHVPEWSPAALEKRLDHFVREDARVPVALEACQGADTGRMGDASAASQSDAETLLGNQIPETSALARSAR
jgi:galactokinase